jgi:ribose transport system substrate-binding protein
MERCQVVSIDGDGQFKTSLERVRRHLRASQARFVLVGAANDPSALGAARAELRQPRTPLIGSVGFFPERYGDGLIRLALDLLSGRPTPPAVFTKHQLITPENVDHYYPNDALLGGVAAARV